MMPYINITDIVKRIRSRPNDAPMPTEHLLDEAADRIKKLEAALREIENYNRNGGSIQTCEIARAALAPEQDK
jgi:hypothetical protein